MPVGHSHTGRLVREPGAAAIQDESLGIFTTGGLKYVEEGRSDYWAGQGDYTNPFSVAKLGGKDNTLKSATYRV